MHNIDQLGDGFCLFYYVRDDIVEYFKPHILTHQTISYCLRSLEKGLLIRDVNFNNTHDPSLTFIELKKQKISSQQLLLWSAPIDTAERYQVFLDSFSNSSSIFEDETLFYNCTPPWFGPSCRFTFYQRIDQSFDDIVSIAFTAKAAPVKGARLTCYEHLNCQTSFSCLSWHNICDRKIDCLDASDETDCWQLEINQCNEDEYRCHNGQCIPQSFFRDVSLNPDCLDQTDEPIILEFQTYCRYDPAFRCEERTCRPGLYDFSCGDGQCVSEVYSCQNGRNSISPDDLCSNAVACFLHFSIIDETWCKEFCTDMNCIKNYCEPPYEFRTGPRLLGHLRFLFMSNEVTFESESKFLPDYVCYDETLCKDFLRATEHLNGSTCRRWYQLQPNTTEGYDHFLLNIKEQFRACLVIADDTHYCKHPSMYQCEKSAKCISNHRLVDGIRDCPFKDDETFNQSCSLKNAHHRLMCLVNNHKMCLSPLLIEDDNTDCDSQEDENFVNVLSTEDGIDFQTICDGNEQLVPILVDEQYETDETTCDHWQCNNTYTRCDKFWHCKDGADEINCPPSTCPQLQHSCVFPNDTATVSCLPIAFAGDGIVHCLGASDERSYCLHLSPETFQYGFHCWNQKQCVNSGLLCNSNENCQLGDDEIFCTNFPDEFDSLCIFYSPESRTEVENFFCEIGDKLNRPQRDYFILSDMPSELRETTIDTVSFPATAAAQIQTQSSRTHTPAINRNNNAWRCNRGLPILVWMGGNTSVLYCLCPQSHYGHLCEYQNQRVSLTVQIRVNMDWRRLLTFLILLIDDQMNTDSHDFIEYFPSRDCDSKFNIYLLHATRPKNTSKIYFVRIDAFSTSTLNYRASWIYPVRFPFLPVHRLSVLLTVPSSDIKPLQKCARACMHGTCVTYVNNQTMPFCRCESGWSGVDCNRKHICDCSSDSLCFADSICLCPLDRFGPHCYLRRSSCRPGACLNGGTCVPGDERRILSRMNKPACVCPEEYSGDRCERLQTRIDISFHSELTVPQSLLIHFLTVRKEAEHDQMSIMKKIRFDQNSLSFFISLTFNMAFAEFRNNYYLIVLREQPIIAANISTKINSSQRCLSIDEVFNKTFAEKHLLRRVKYYHIPCGERSNLVCFYDKIHLCLCDLYRRANCFKFDRNRTYDCRGANLCDNDGRCFEDYSKCATSSLCVCHDCYYGSRCQVSTKGSSLSLDAILGYQIHRNIRISQQPTITKVAIVLSTIVSLLGFISNLLSLLTFRSEATRHVGCGSYLFALSITSMITMSICIVKVWFLLTSQIGSISNRRFIHVQCIFMDFSLRFLLSTVDWLSGCVAIERAVSISKGIHFNKTKSKLIAKWIILVVVAFTPCTYIHDPINRHLIYDEEEQRLWCSAKYSPSLQIFDSTINVLHFFMPFLINCISACIIIIVAARNRLATQKKLSYMRFLHEQFKHHKHLLISPCILIILALPRLIISFLSGCMKSGREEHWLYLTGYFISFSPPVLTLIVFVLPSAMYKKELADAIKRLCRK